MSFEKQVRQKGDAFRNVGEHHQVRHEDEHEGNRLPGDGFRAVSPFFRDSVLHDHEGDAEENPRSDTSHEALEDRHVGDDGVENYGAAGRNEKARQARAGDERRC